MERSSSAHQNEHL